jgi:signal transduction histidine kinase
MTRPVDIRAVISGLVPLLRQLLGPETEIAVDMPERPMIVHLDSGQLEQALINLAVNARDAMPKGGQLTFAVRSGRRSLADPARTAMLGDAFVELEVRDSGSGIPYELQDRIFEPFFTTKGVGRGSGLGLAMVSGFAARAGGEVSVESEPGKGTTFAIRLPEARLPETRPGAGTRSTAIRPMRGSSLSPGRRQLGRAT